MIASINAVYDGGFNCCSRFSSAAGDLVRNDLNGLNILNDWSSTKNLPPSGAKPKDIAIEIYCGAGSYLASAGTRR
jgi:hypothetical protein